MRATLLVLFHQVRADTYVVPPAPLECRFVCHLPQSLTYLYNQITTLNCLCTLCFATHFSLRQTLCDLWETEIMCFWLAYTLKHQNVIL